MKEGHRTGRPSVRGTYDGEAFGDEAALAGGAAAAVIDSEVSAGSRVAPLDAAGRARLRSAPLRDVEELGRLADCVDPHEIQALGAPQGGSVAGIEVEGIGIEHVCVPADFMVHKESPRVTLITALTHRDDRARVNGHSIHHRRALLFGSGAEMLGSTEAGTNMLVVTMEPSLLEDATDALGVDIDAPRSSGPVVLEGERGAVPSSAIDLLEGPLAAVTDLGPANAIADLVETIALALAEQDQSAAVLRQRARATSFALVCDAIDYSAARDLRDIRISAVSRAIGTSQNRLRVAFQTVLGVSPKTYFTTRALHEGRRLLLKASVDGTSVSQAAAQVGFWHFGRFAHSYHELFGELPSETLRAQRRTRRRAV